MSSFKLHISPCPNDTFIFHAMIHGLVDTEGLDFEPVFDDIDLLNRSALLSPCDEDVVKVSYASLPAVLASGEGYYLLESGGALGHGNGPVVVSRSKIYPDELADAVIAIPGEMTTANRLLEVLYPEAQRKKVYLFSDIAPAVADGEVDAGVLIHEGRFTYPAYGLRKVADLGEEWEKSTGLPIPLGGILVSRRHAPETASAICRVIRRSIAYGFTHPAASESFVREHAREMDDEVRQNHISFFVNDYSRALGDKGKEAVERLLGEEAEVEYIE